MRAALAIVLAGCGRFGFAPELDANGPSPDDATAMQSDGTVDPCPAVRVIGTICTGGGIYAGTFQGREYMVTAPGCENSPMPTCMGNDYRFQRDYDPAGARIDMPELTNIANAASPSPITERGDYNTPTIIIDNPTSAAGFCSDLDWGGFSDWYLPSKSELAYIYCKSLVTPPTLAVPESDPGCTLAGGKTFELTGWSTAVTRVYWSSTEKDIQFAWTLDFRDGTEQDSIKNNPFAVRCARSW